MGVGFRVATPAYFVDADSKPVAVSLRLENDFLMVLVRVSYVVELWSCEAVKQWSSEAVKLWSCEAVKQWSSEAVKQWSSEVVK